MARRRKLEHHRRSLDEIREIMNSMKTLAYMETRKLARFLDAQQAVVKSIEDAAADLLSFYPEILPTEQASTPVYLLFGTERGFCGDFNHELLRHLESDLQQRNIHHPVLIAVGRKLYSLLEHDQRLAAAIDGASVVEEVTSLIHTLVTTLTDIQQQYGSLSVSAFYHSSEEIIEMQPLLPPFRHLQQQPPAYAQPPLLNLTPQQFLVELTDHYLFAALHEMLYTSLMVENHHRLAHLEGAVKHLDDELEELRRQSNMLRQEEIVEEIEVILLSASSLDESQVRRKTGMPHEILTQDAPTDSAQ
ncbi:MAG: FoF1 ATP synthase subunit gamma [Chromatiales bacterium]|jgi:F-type H+-transporting ATPase subunit gamma